MDDGNPLLRDARVRIFGTRQALAEAANRHLAPRYRMTANDIGKLERRVVGRPSVPRRAALRRVLGVAGDTDIGFAHSPGVLTADADSWRDVMDQYGRRYYSAPPEQLADSLRTDLETVGRLLASGPVEDRPRLFAVGSQLSLLMGMAASASPEPALVERWRSSAGLAAARSEDPRAILLVAAWTTFYGLYERRPPAEIAEQAVLYLSMARDDVSPAVAVLYAGRAQALAMIGRYAEATAALDTVARLTERLPGDSDSLFAWPEHRLRYTESFVAARSGDSARAEAARRRALELCPPSFERLRAQIALHHSVELVAAGEVAGGLRDATRIVTGLDAPHRTAILREVARQVLDVAPASARRTDAYAELAAAVAPPPS